MKRTKKLLVLSALSTLTGSFVSTSFTPIAYADSGNFTYSAAGGTNRTTAGGHIAIGHNASTEVPGGCGDEHHGAVAIGTYAKVVGHYGVAIGAGAEAVESSGVDDGGSGAIAVGSMSKAGTMSSLAIGSWA